MDSILQNILWAFGAALVTVVPSILIYHANQKRKEGIAEEAVRVMHERADEHRKITQAQWGTMDRHGKLISDTQKDVAVLQSRISDLPTSMTIQAMMQAQEQRIEARLDRLAENMAIQIEGFMQRERDALNKCAVPGCPLHHGNGHRD